MWAWFALCGCACIPASFFIHSAIAMRLLFPIMYFWILNMLSDLLIKPRHFYHTRVYSTGATSCSAISKLQRTISCLMTVVYHICHGQCVSFPAEVGMCVFNLLPLSALMCSVPVVTRDRHPAPIRARLGRWDAENSILPHHIKHSFTSTLARATYGPQGSTFYECICSLQALKHTLICAIVLIWGRH